MGYADRPNWHRHQCPECGTVWEHENPPEDDVSTEAERDLYRSRHKCPGCGCGERWRYTGPLPPAEPGEPWPVCSNAARSD